MLSLKSPQITQETVLRWKKDGPVALVPTMGALHEGHLSLVRMAQKYGRRTVVSIFVNPLQFGPTEDLSRYPRTPEQDEALLEGLGVDLLFNPDPSDLYPPGFQNRVKPGPLTHHLCGASRPGHFEGVATVCLKLFHTTLADFAVFGEKDFQQLRVIQQLTADFNMPLTILPHPTVREADGLALSSRNRYLTPSERQQAAEFPRALRRLKERAQGGQWGAGALLESLGQELKAAGLTPDYLTIAPENTLQPLGPNDSVPEFNRPRLFAAIKVGRTRLIDNLSLVDP